MNKEKLGARTSNRSSWAEKRSLSEGFGKAPIFFVFCLGNTMLLDLTKEKEVRKISAKQKEKRNWEMLGTPATIVRKIRDLERWGMEFATFVTLTYRREPLEGFRGPSNASVKRLCRTLIGRKAVTCIFLACERDENRTHFHLAIDKFIDMNFIRKNWKWGYVHVDAVKMHRSAKYYLYKNMNDQSENYRLYYNEPKILERFLEKFQKIC